MNEADVADWVRGLSKNERLILGTYEGGSCMPDAMDVRNSPDRGYAVATTTRTFSVGKPAQGRRTRGRR